MPGRAKCQPGCACEKHSRPRMSPDEARERQRAISSAYYQANKERILARERAERRDPVAGEEKRRRERERAASLSPQQRERRAQLNRDWYRRNPRPGKEAARQHLRHRYGLSPEHHAQMVADQNGNCYLCGEPLDLENPRKIHVDHDHACCRGSRSCGACIRGLACEGCNTGIGCFGDDPARMELAAARLRAAQAEVMARKTASAQQELPLNVRRLDRPG